MRTCAHTYSLCARFQQWFFFRRVEGRGRSQASRLKIRAAPDATELEHDQKQSATGCELQISQKWQREIAPGHEYRSGPALISTLDYNRDRRWREVFSRSEVARTQSILCPMGCPRPRRTRMPTWPTSRLTGPK